MKIAYIVETFTEGLGYIDNVLPFVLARKSHNVHLFTCKLPPYYQFSTNLFGDLQNNEVNVGCENRDGVAIHTLSAIRLGSRVLMRGLIKKLRCGSFDVVVIRGIASPVLMQVVLAQRFRKFRLYTSTGQAHSAMPDELRFGRRYSKARIGNFLTRYLPGRLCSLGVTQCIASTSDGADSCVEFYGVPRSKLQVIPLGVDVDLFRPADDPLLLAERGRVRKGLGIEKNQIACIWTGRMTGEKGLHILAQAVDELCVEGYPFVALFIGDGPEKQILSKYKNYIIREFMPWKELAMFYRAVDIAVWPKSITTSTLDASASGLPIVMSDSEKAVERWEGIGQAYEDGSVVSLKRVLRTYATLEHRQAIGAVGVRKMRQNYSWDKMADKFIELFEAG